MTIGVIIVCISSSLATALSQPVDLYLTHVGHVPISVGEHAACHALSRTSPKALAAFALHFHTWSAHSLSFQKS